MKVTVVGAGAIGGLLGCRLALDGRARISALARGATLAALRQHGWRLQPAGGGGLLQAPAHASDRAEDLGVQDAVILAVKAPALAALAPALAPLIGPRTTLLPAMNGIPWWFSHGLPALGGVPLESVDPAGRIAAALPPEQVVGCVVHASTRVAEPGLVQQVMGQGLILGEPAGGLSARAQALADLLAAAGFDVTHSERLRHELWYKLWGNLTTNPMSALTGATTDRLLADPLTRAFCTTVMDEAAAIGARIGCRIEQTPEDRHAITTRLGAFKTSMLQDVEAGRPIELDGLVTSVREIAGRVGVPTPAIDALLGLTRVFAQVHGLYPESPQAGRAGQTPPSPALPSP